MPDPEAWTDARVHMNTGMGSTDQRVWVWERFSDQCNMKTRELETKPPQMTMELVS